MITTPKRRHLQRNFASLVADRMASILGIPFYEDVALPLQTAGERNLYNECLPLGAEHYRFR